MGIHDRQEHPLQVDSLFFSFLLLQPGANSLNLPKTSALDNVKSQKSPRKRKEGEGGIDRYFSSSHKGLLVCVPPVDGWSAVSPAQLLSSLLCSAELCRSAAPPLNKCCLLSQSSRKAPPFLKSKRGQTHPLIDFPPLRVVSLSVGQERGANQRSPPLRSRPAIGRKSRAKVSTPPFGALCAVLPQTWREARSAKSKLEPCNLMCSSCLRYQNQHVEALKSNFIRCHVEK